MFAVTYWTEPAGDYLGMMQANGDKAFAAGFEMRPLEQTARETLEWFNAQDAERQELRSGLMPEREADEAIRRAPPGPSAREELAADRSRLGGERRRWSSMPVCGCRPLTEPMRCRKSARPFSRWLWRGGSRSLSPSTRSSRSRAPWLAGCVTRGRGATSPGGCWSPRLSRRIPRIGPCSGKPSRFAPGSFFGPGTPSTPLSPKGWSAGW